MAALKGKAEALISQAADYLEQNIDPNVVDNCREAVAALTSAEQGVTARMVDY